MAKGVDVIVITILILLAFWFIVKGYQGTLGQLIESF